MYFGHVCYPQLLCLRSSPPPIPSKTPVRLPVLSSPFSESHLGWLVSPRVDTWCCEPHQILPNKGSQEPDYPAPSSYHTLRSSQSPQLVVVLHIHLMKYCGFFSDWSIHSPDVAQHYFLELLSSLQLLQFLQLFHLQQSLNFGVRREFII